MWKIIWSICTLFLILPPSEPKTCDIWNHEIQDYFPLPLFEWEDGLVNVNSGLSSLIEIEDGKTINMSCIGSYLQYYNVGYKHMDSVVVNCNDGKFTSDEWIPGKELLMLWVSCYQPPNVLQRHTRTKCGEEDKGRITEMYMESKYQNDHFLYEVCFDDTIKQPLYVKYTAENKYKDSFRNTRTIHPYGDSLIFSDVRIQELYMFSYYRNIFYEVLGGNFWDYLNNDEIFYGPLIDAQNFPLDSVQRATYDYINYVPIWGRINKGSWLSATSGVQSLAEETDIIVYSGAWGVQTLKDSNGEQKEIRLESIESMRYPIPQWLYKVAYDEKSKKGIAILILNNPFITIEEAKELAEIFSCSDVCPDWNWIVNVKPQDGYVTCCEVNDFRKVIKNLPDFETSGILP